MLILSRHIGQEIILGELGEIKIMLVGFRKGEVRIGITAPRTVPVDRKEIYDLKQKDKQENKKAAA